VASDQLTDRQTVCITELALLAMSQDSFITNLQEDLLAKDELLRQCQLLPGEDHQGEEEEEEEESYESGLGSGGYVPGEAVEDLEEEVEEVENLAGSEQDQDRPPFSYVRFMNKLSP